MKKNIIGIVICFILSVLIVFCTNLLDDNNETVYGYESSSLLKQEISAFTNKKTTYNKLYNSGKLVGVISDLDFFYSEIDKEYQKYEDKFPNTSLGLSEDLYIVKEDTYNVFENIDEEIVSYLVENDLLGVKTNAIEFSTDGNVYDVIYVNDLDDFKEARDIFLLNFISEDTLKLIRNNKTISDPSDFGTIETGISILETITYSYSFVSPDKIYTSADEIYEYLCYGRNSERQYYTVEEGDTLRGVGYRFSNMSPTQLMLINKDKIFSEDQVLSPGMELNVTYFSSPLTVVVTKERLTQEVIMPAAPEYISDASIEAGTSIIETEEQNGLENVLYEEKWINGVLQSGDVKSSYVVRQAIQGIIKIGTARKSDVGTGNYTWPVDNPKITCGWGCYYIEGIGSHRGTDFVNQYERYGAVYAADTGVVETATYNWIDGNYVVIDHQNGYKTHYGHMSQILVSEGQTVTRGEQIGIMGSTGYAFGVHTHFHFIIDGVVTDACTIMDCTQVPWS